MPLVIKDPICVYHFLPPMSKFDKFTSSVMFINYGRQIFEGTGVSELLGTVAGWKSIVSLDSILLACLFSGAVGVFFGFYPARKASRMDPIDALRYE